MVSTEKFGPWSLELVLLLRSTLGEHILFMSLLSGCCAISGFGCHLGLAGHSPRFHARAFESRWLSEVPQVDSFRSECHEIERTLLIHDY